MLVLLYMSRRKMTQQKDFNLKIEVHSVKLLGLLFHERKEGFKGLLNFCLNLNVVTKCSPEIKKTS